MTLSYTARQIASTQHWQRLEVNYLKTMKLESLNSEVQGIALKWVLEVGRGNKWNFTYYILRLSFSPCPQPLPIHGFQNRGKHMFKLKAGAWESLVWSSAWKNHVALFLEEHSLPALLTKSLISSLNSHSNRSSPLETLICSKAYNMKDRV